MRTKHIDLVLTKTLSGLNDDVELHISGQVCKDDREADPDVGWAARWEIVFYDVVDNETGKDVLLTQAERDEIEEEILAEFELDD